MPNDVSRLSASDSHQWLGNLKTRFVQVQLKAAVAVNTGLGQKSGQLNALK